MKMRIMDNTFDLKPVIEVVADIVEAIEGDDKTEPLLALSWGMGAILAQMFPKRETQSEHLAYMDVIQGWTQVGFNHINKVNEDQKREQSENQAEKTFPAGSSIDEVINEVLGSFGGEYAPEDDGY